MFCHVHAGLLKANGIDKLMEIADLSSESAGSALFSVVNIARTTYLIQVSSIMTKSRCSECS